MNSIHIDRPDTEVFSDLSHALLRDGISLRFQARGASMNPTIRDGEILHVKPVSECLKRGDIVLVQQEGKFRAHRLIYANQVKNVFITRGDAGGETDSAVNSSQIVGRVVAKDVCIHGETHTISLCNLPARAVFYARRARTVAHMLADSTISWAAQSCSARPSPQ